MLDDLNDARDAFGIERSIPDFIESNSGDRVTFPAKVTVLMTRNLKDHHFTHAIAIRSDLNTINIELPYINREASICRTRKVKSVKR